MWHREREGKKKMTNDSNTNNRKHGKNEEREYEKAKNNHKKEHRSITNRKRRISLMRIQNH